MCFDVSIYLQYFYFCVLKTEDAQTFCPFFTESSEEERECVCVCVFFLWGGAVLRLTLDLNLG